MRKNYMLTFCLLLGSLLMTAQTTSDEPTFVITELLPPEGESGVIYRESRYDAHLEVKVCNVTPLKRLGTNFFHCLPEPNSFYDYPYLELVGANNADDTSTAHSYVELHNLGDADIERVEFLLGSIGISRLVASASIDGLDYFTADHENEKGQSVYKRITVEGMDDLCDSNYSYDVPNKIEDPYGEGESIIDARKKLKFVRLNWGKYFADATTEEKGDPSDIFAIKVYTNADTSLVSLEENEKESVEINLYGRNLQLSQWADLSIYDMTGRVVLEYDNIDNAYLDNLGNGIYLIKVNCNGKITTQKVVIQ